MTGKRGIAAASIFAVVVIGALIYLETRPPPTEEDRVRAAFERTVLVEQATSGDLGDLVRRAEVERILVQENRATVWCAEGIFFSYQRRPPDGDWELSRAGVVTTGGAWLAVLQRKLSAHLPLRPRKGTVAEVVEVGPEGHAPLGDLSGMPDCAVLVDADPDLPFQAVIDVLDAIRAAGHTGAIWFAAAGAEDVPAVERIIAVR
jgi:hypothetical protein